MHFDTEQASLHAFFKFNAFIQAPTLIYQNEEYWCEGAGCSCKYSLQDTGEALPYDAYTETVSGPFTEFYVTDPSLDDSMIEIYCTRNKVDIERVDEL